MQIDGDPLRRAFSIKTYQGFQADGTPICYALEVRSLNRAGNSRRFLVVRECRIGRARQAVHEKRGDVDR